MVEAQVLRGMLLRLAALIMGERRRLRWFSAGGLASGGISLGSSSPSSAGSSSSVLGYPATAGSASLAEDAEWSSGSSDIYNQIALFGTSSVAPYNSNGLPVLGNAASQSNELVDSVNSSNVGVLNYTITSLTPVPLPRHRVAAAKRTCRTQARWCAGATPRKFVSVML